MIKKMFFVVSLLMYSGMAYSGDSGSQKGSSSSDKSTQQALLKGLHDEDDAPENGDVASEYVKGLQALLAAREAELAAAHEELEQLRNKCVPIIEQYAQDLKDCATQVQGLKAAIDGVEAQMNSGSGLSADERVVRLQRELASAQFKHTMFGALGATVAIAMAAVLNAFSSMPTQ